jgi:hypothetical protein
VLEKQYRQFHPAFMRDGPRSIGSRQTFYHR